MVILIFEWEKASGFQVPVSGFLFPLFKETNSNKFWDCMSRDMSSYFIMFYILNKTKTYRLCNSGGFGYRWIDFRKWNPSISTCLKLKMCDWQSDNLQWPAHLTVFRFDLFGLNQFANFCPPLLNIASSSLIDKRYWNDRIGYDDQSSNSISDIFWAFKWFFFSTQYWLSNDILSFQMILRSSIY
jgi:hypothetical protein